MSERPPNEIRRIECPFIESCTAQVTQQQYEAYCNEVATTPHQPNHQVCPTYQKLMNSPRMWRTREQGSIDDMGQGQSRTRGHGV